jgi:hypothetical protein
MSIKDDKEVECKDVKCTTNFFTFVPRGAHKELFKYSLDFLPEVEPRMQKLRERIFARIRYSINKDFMNVVYEGNNELYSQNNVPDVKQYTAKVGKRGAETEYTVTIKWVKTITSSDSDALVFYGIFTNHMFSRLQLNQIGRKHFNPKASVKLNNDLRIMPGFASSVGSFEKGIMVNIDSSHRVLREETALDVIKSNRGDMGRMKGCLIGEVVLTNYNKN